jgi:hypothetical protein
MRLISDHLSKFSSLLTVITLFSLLIFGSALETLAHGGEDHGDEKPKTATTTAGTISRTARLGELEVMLKHSPLEPDAGSVARLFITKFATNEPAGNANPAIEIESANGSVSQIPVEKTETGGSYAVKIPALPEGAYTVRIKTTVGDKTDTATFPGVEVAHQEAAAESGGGSWLQTALTALLFLVALAIFGALVYLAVRVIKNKPLREETVSA